MRWQEINSTCSGIVKNRSISFKVKSRFDRAMFTRLIKSKSWINSCVFEHNSFTCAKLEYSGSSITSNSYSSRNPLIVRTDVATKLWASRASSSWVWTIVLSCAWFQWLVFDLSKQTSTAVFFFNNFFFNSSTSFRRSGDVKRSPISREAFFLASLVISSRKFMFFPLHFSEISDRATSTHTGNFRFSTRIFKTRGWGNSTIKNGRQEHPEIWLTYFSTMILKLAVNRIQIHKNKKIELSMEHKKNVGELLVNGKDLQARVMVHLITFFCTYWTWSWGCICNLWRLFYWGL